MLLAAAARQMGIAERLGAAIPARRDPVRFVHPLPRIALARILAMASGSLAMASGSEAVDDLGYVPAPTSP